MLFFAHTLWGHTACFLLTCHTLPHCPSPPQPLPPLPTYHTPTPPPHCPLPSPPAPPPFCLPPQCLTIIPKLDIRSSCASRLPLQCPTTFCSETQVQDDLHTPVVLCSVCLFSLSSCYSSGLRWASWICASLRRACASGLWPAIRCTHEALGWDGLVGGWISSLPHCSLPHHTHHFMLLIILSALTHTAHSFPTHLHTCTLTLHLATLPALLHTFVDWGKEKTGLDTPAHCYRLPPAWSVACPHTTTRAYRTCGTIWMAAHTHTYRQQRRALTTGSTRWRRANSGGSAQRRALRAWRAHTARARTDRTESSLVGAVEGGGLM